MANLRADSEKVLAVMRLLPEPSVRVLAATLGWRGGKDGYNYDTERTHNALLALAAERLVTQVPGQKGRMRWTLCRKIDDKQGDT